jgi:transcriptional regulator with GAF, ATPase, and Fis domain
MSEKARPPGARDDELETELREVVARDDGEGTAFEVRVVEGVDQGASITLDGTHALRALVGKSPSCVLRLTDPQVSRRHAALDLVDGDARIVDLESTNGLFVNGLRVTDVFLRGGEELRLGATTLRIDRVSKPASARISRAKGFGKILGSSSEMRRLYPLCERVAASDVPVLIEGETGTGKEVLAESIHEAGPRALQPFVVFDCTEISSTLAESELFGHEAGAFTGASSMRRGVFEQAHGGTLLIDEIGELSLELQPKLLRVVERGEVRRVGGERRIPVDVRLIIATRRDLDREVQEGRFRDDLFYRLAVARIELPPLRSRGGDVAVLARHFWSSLGGDEQLPHDVLQRLESYRWPGNVRELRNALVRRRALGHPLANEAVARPPLEREIGPSADALERVLALDLPFTEARGRILREFEQRYIERVLAQHGGNVTHAAQASGIARRYFNLLRSRQSNG